MGLREEVEEFLRSEPVILLLESNKNNKRVLDLIDSEGIVFEEFDVDQDEAIKNIFTEISKTANFPQRLAFTDFDF
ncbi:hypothetical protein MHBO_004686 [Bonamia ostreae]|uniref:Glutaredoxin domain-containing protein n=1 Tax=Bonamia ostreae TaxID=126728 RepID=A0ABV2AUN4_9EUKA